MNVSFSRDSIPRSLGWSNGFRAKKEVKDSLSCRDIWSFTLDKMQLFVKRIERLFGKLSSCALLPNDTVSVVFTALFIQEEHFLQSDSIAQCE